MVALVDPRQAERVLKAVRASGQAAWRIGEVVPGTGITRVV
jgi:phosphoribosylaminoimidazole (AIR) synthetase